MLAILVLLIIALAGTVRAQTQAQIQSCGNSIVLATYQDVVTYSTGDTGAFFNATYTYSPTYCNGIPITRITLSNLVSGGTFTCTAPTTFGTSGSLYTQCTESLGAMATAAQAGDTDCESQVLHRRASFADGQGRSSSEVVCGLHGSSLRTSSRLRPLLSLLARCIGDDVRLGPWRSFR
jgi:hypothetical protein